MVSARPFRQATEQAFERASERALAAANYNLIAT